MKEQKNKNSSEKKEILSKLQQLANIKEHEVTERLHHYSAAMAMPSICEYSEEYQIRYMPHHTKFTLLIT